MKKKIILGLFLMIITGILFGCSPPKPTDEEILSDIKSYLESVEYDNITLTYENLKEEEPPSSDSIEYSFDVIETRQSDETSAYFIPDYKARQKYYITYDEGENAWLSNSPSYYEDVVFEYLEEPNMDDLVETNFEDYDSYEIVDSTLDLENGRANYTLNLFYEGEFFSKTTEATFDLFLNSYYSDKAWAMVDDPKLKDLSMDTGSLLGKWKMDSSNGSVVSIEIKDISDATATVHFSSTKLSGMGLLDTVDTDWIGEQDKEVMNLFRSQNITLYFPTEKGSNHIRFNGENFYKYE